MSSLAVVVLLMASITANPIILDVDRGEEELVIQCGLSSGVPESVIGAVSSGARVEIDYLLRVYSRRKFFPDRKIWKGVARTTVTFDAVTGRYLCQLIVNGSTTASREVDSAEVAEQWLAAPPPIEIPIPKGRRDAFLRVRSRAVFSSGTTWLIFPSTEGTDWIEVQLEAQREE
ncbi:MAG: DUF4390 domain-containing protein [Acidobacteria bacterium]|jgi:hypothetical protein|nr:DUF4390 domain-containing protein [Acidobacteriota bacterium]